MRVALIDPSLFTLPYDVALTAGLRACGHDVVLHGRRPRGDDGAARRVVVTESFYRFSGAPVFDAMPKPVRLGVKGVDHVVSMAALKSRLARDRPDIIHFQWLPLPIVDRFFVTAMRPIAPIVLTVHDSNPFNGESCRRPAAPRRRRELCALRPHHCAYRSGPCATGRAGRAALTHHGPAAWAARRTQRDAACGPDGWRARVPAVWQAQAV